MPTVVLTVDCEAANYGKCYTRELVKVAEEFAAPLTWLVFVSENDPISNIDLYHSEYLHRIPSWHELGLLLSFENSNGYISDPRERGDAIRIGKDTVKSRHIKPSAFRAHKADLHPTDLKHLEDIGILADVSACPNAKCKHDVTWPDGPANPYHPSYESLSREGSARLWMFPIAAYHGICGYLDFGWDRVQPLLENSLKKHDVTVLALSDHVDNAETLRRTLAYCKQNGARLTTVTQLAAEM